MPHSSSQAAILLPSYHIVVSLSRRGSFALQNSNEGREYLVAYLLLAVLSFADASIGVEIGFNGPRPTYARIYRTRKYHSFSRMFPSCARDSRIRRSRISRRRVVSEDESRSFMAPRYDNYPGKMAGIKHHYSLRVVGSRFFLQATGMQLNFIWKFGIAGNVMSMR